MLGLVDEGSRTDIGLIVGGTMVLICLVVVVVQALLLCSFISYVQKSWLSIIVPSSLLGTEIYF